MEPGYVIFCSFESESKPLGYMEKNINKSLKSVFVVSH